MGMGGSAGGPAIFARTARELRAARSVRWSVVDVQGERRHPAARRARGA